MKNDNQEKFSIQEDKPADWFEPLYANANIAGDGVPWANMDTHPSFKRWLAQNPLTGQSNTGQTSTEHTKKALVIGCGMGDDAIALEQLGFEVTAFDVSDTAIKLCNQRFPESNVNFLQADLLKEQAQWENQFDFVLEIYTVQALPPKYEDQLIKSIASFVTNSGQLLVVAEVSPLDRLFENGPPWLLTIEHIDSFVACGLKLQHTLKEETPLEEGEASTYVSTFIR